MTCRLTHFLMLVLIARVVVAVVVVDIAGCICDEARPEDKVAPVCVYSTKACRILLLCEKEYKLANLACFVAHPGSTLGSGTLCNAFQIRRVLAIYLLLFTSISFFLKKKTLSTSSLLKVR